MYKRNKRSTGKADLQVKNFKIMANTLNAFKSLKVTICILRAMKKIQMPLHLSNYSMRNVKTTVLRWEFNVTKLRKLKIQSTSLSFGCLS